MNSTHLALPDSGTLVMIQFGIHIRIDMIFILQLLAQCCKTTECSCFCSSIPTISNMTTHV